MLWQGSANLDLTEAKAHLYPVSCVKQPGKTGDLSVTFSDIDPDLSKGNLDFKLNGDITQPQDLDVAGSLKW